jgi:hypothetical protein
LSCGLSLRATVHNVSNDPNKPAQYSSPATALAAAAPGDTLYIYGSPNNYGSFTIDKNITIIGSGYNTRKDVFHKTVFGAITLTGPDRNGVTIDGIYLTNFVISVGVQNYSNITLRNSIISGSISGAAGSSMSCGSTFTNWLIENCYIASLGAPGNTSCNPISPVTTGFLVKNSFIQSSGGGTQYNMTFTNCQFGSESSAITGFINCVFNNSIFYRMAFTQNTTNQNNLFNNCLTYQTQSPSANFDLNSWTGGASGSAINCIINQNPLWVTIPSYLFFNNSTPGIRNGWDPALQGGSPAANAGADNTDIGLTGGSVPYNPLAEPGIPVIRMYQMVNAVVPPNGTVTVNATATKAQ